MGTRGTGLIKLASIMLLIAGGVNICLMSVIILNSGYENMIGDETILSGLSVFGAYLVGLLQIVGAIIGFINCGNDKKANIIMVMGIILIVVTIGWLVPEVVTTNQIINWYVYGYSMLFAVIYYVGGKQHKFK